MKTRNDRHHNGWTQDPQTLELQVEEENDADAYFGVEMTSTNHVEIKEIMNSSSALLSHKDMYMNKKMVLCTARMQLMMIRELK